VLLGVAGGELLPGAAKEGRSDFEPESDLLLFASALLHWHFEARQALSDVPHAVVTHDWQSAPGHDVAQAPSPLLI
jgi:hypothetical protein